MQLNKNKEQNHTYEHKDFYVVRFKLEYVFMVAYSSLLFEN